MVAPKSPLVIGLTGGIGSGKTTVARLLGDLGCVVVESDAVARDVLAKEEVRSELVKWWGEDVLDVDGGIDRARVAKIVFQDASQRIRLEALTHPLIEAKRQAVFAAVPPDVPALVLDAPLLLESGLQETCDVVIMIESSREDRVRRVLGRGWQGEELDSREAAQMGLDEKRSMADHVLWNTGDLEALRCDVETLLRGIIEQHE